MDKDLIRGVILVFLTCVSLASLVSSNEKTGTRCSDGLGLNYTLPMFIECKMKLHSNGSMVQTFPKLIPYSSAEAACPRRKSKLGIPPGHRVCRFPDCGKNTCQNGWCEETMKNFRCHCSAGYRGKRCDKQSTTTQDTTAMSTTEATISHPTTTTQSTTTQDITTMSSTGATTSHPTTTTQSTTTQDTTPMSTTEATTSHPTTTTQSTTTQDTTTMSTTEATTSHPTTTTQSTTTQDTTTMSSTEVTTSHPTTNTQSTTTQDTIAMSATEATTSHPTTTTQSTTTQDTTAMSSTGATTSHPTTTTQSTTTQDTTTMSSTEAITSHPTTTTQSTTTQDTTTMSSTEATTSHHTTTTQTTTTQDTTSMSTTDSTTSRPSTTTQSTAKIFVTDEGTEYKIFVADLQADLDFTSIPSTKEPRFITYDSVEKKIYWTDKGTKRVYRADEDGGNREEVTSKNDNEPQGIGIADSSRILYIAYKGSKKITTVDIRQRSAFPRNEVNFATGFFNDPYSLEVDEKQGFLYVSIKDSIWRKSLDGHGMKGYNYLGLSEITGLSIDLSRNPRRIFFCDFGNERTFYTNVDRPLIFHELTVSMNDPDISGDEERPKLQDISYFNGSLYWTKEDSPKGIAVMTYDQSNPSFHIIEISEIDTPFQFLITSVDP